jgi:putative addiction module killer protein
MVTQELPSAVIKVEEYLDERGRSPYAKWFNGLPAQAAAKVTTVKTRMGQGNLSNVSGVGEGVYEREIDWGPGYRVYFGKDGENLIILLGGGSKHRQQSDIDSAKERWKDYKKRKMQQSQQE